MARLQPPSSGPLGVAGVDYDEADADSEEIPDGHETPSFLDPEAAHGMHHNDEKLQELLMLARACLRSGRCPGEPRPQDLFDRWDQEAAEAEQRERAYLAELDRRAAEELGVDATQAPRKAPQPPPISKTPENLSVREHISKLRRDLLRIERSSQEKRQELEATSGQVSRVVLERCKAQDNLEKAQDEVAKAKKAIREVKDMFRRQQREIREMTEAIELSKLQGASPNSRSHRRLAAAAQQTSAPAGSPGPAAPAAVPVQPAHSAPPPQPQPAPPQPQPAPPQPAQAPAPAPRPQSPEKPISGDVLGGGKQNLAPPQPSSEIAADFEVMSVAGTLATEELKEQLMRCQDPRPPSAELHIYGHLQSENDKIMSVIDAIGELSQHLREPRAAHGGAGPSHGGAGVGLAGVDQERLSEGVGGDSGSAIPSERLNTGDTVGRPGSDLPTETTMRQLSAGVAAPSPLGSAANPSSADITPEPSERGRARLQRSQGPPVLGGLLQNLQPPSQRAMPSVLTTRPKHHKAFM